MRKRGAERYDDEGGEVVARGDSEERSEDVQEAKRLKQEQLLDSVQGQLVDQRNEHLLQREERSLYLNTVHSMAVALGFKLRSILDAERFAGLVFSQVPHNCAFDLDKNSLSEVTHVTCNIVTNGVEYFDPEEGERRSSLGSAYMCTYSGKLHRCVKGKFCSKTTLARSPPPQAVLESLLREVQIQRTFVVNDRVIAEARCEPDKMPPLSRMDAMYSSWVFNPENKHLCSLDFKSTSKTVRPCQVFHLAQGTTYLDPFEAPKEVLRSSSGTLQICYNSGYCLMHLLGDTPVFARNFVSLKTQLQRFFQQSENRSRDQGYVCLLTNQHKQGIVDITPVLEKGEKVSLARLAKFKNRQERAEEDQSVGSFDNGDLDDEIEEDEVPLNELDPDEAKAHELVVKRGKVVLKPLEEDAAAAATELEPTTKTAAKRKRVKLERNGDDLDKERAGRIFKLLTAFNTRKMLYYDELSAANLKAHERLRQVQRQTKHSMPDMELYRIYYEALASLMRLSIPEELPEIDPKPYIEMLMRCWGKVAESPFLVEYKVNKRTQPTFTKMVVAALYRIAEGGFVVNCDFSEAEQLQMKKVVALYPKLATMKIAVEILPYGELLAPHLAAKTHLGRLSDLSNSKIRLDDGMIGRGKQLLSKAFDSIVRRKKREVINTMELCTSTSEIATCLLDYIKFCNSLRCCELVKRPQQQ